MADTSNQQIGPRPAKLSCKGCPSHDTKYWEEPSGDGETYDNGTLATCKSASGRVISTYDGSQPSVPDWCPALAKTEAA
jgi:hypothetical protein